MATWSASIESSYQRTKLMGWGIFALDVDHSSHRYISLRLALLQRCISIEIFLNNWTVVQSRGPSGGNSDVFGNWIERWLVRWLVKKTLNWIHLLRMKVDWDCLIMISNFLFHIEAKRTYDAGGGHTASERASQYDGLLTWLVGMNG